MDGEMPGFVRKKDYDTVLKELQDAQFNAVSLRQAIDVAVQSREAVLSRFKAVAIEYHAWRSMGQLILFGGGEASLFDEQFRIRVCRRVDELQDALTAAQNALKARDRASTKAKVSAKPAKKKAGKNRSLSRKSV